MPSSSQPTPAVDPLAQALADITHVPVSLAQAQLHQLRRMTARAQPVFPSPTAFDVASESGTPESEQPSAQRVIDDALQDQELAQALNRLIQQASLSFYAQEVEKLARLTQDLAQQLNAASSLLASRPTCQQLSTPSALSIYAAWDAQVDAHYAATSAPVKPDDPPVNP